MDVRPKRFWILIGCTAVLPVLYVLVWVTGGTHNAWTHLFYLPIILAALAVNWQASLVIALASGILLSGWMIPRDTVAMVPQLASAWVIRLIMFAAVSRRLRWWITCAVGQINSTTKQWSSPASSMRQWEL